MRLEQLKQNILAQLGYTEPPEAPADAGPPPEIDTDILDDYEELVAAAADSEAKCISGDFYAKPINSFVGVLSPVEGKKKLNLRLRESAHTICGCGRCSHVIMLLSAGLVTRYKRGNDELDGWGIPDENGNAVDDVILNQYTITVDFNLPRNLSDISEANLVLHQKESNTIDYPVLDRYQLVQIRTVIDNVRYNVEQSVFDVYGYGPTSLDIKRAVELWVQNDVSDSAVLEVLVSCYSSPNCSLVNTDGIVPAKVSFVDDTSDSSKLPRVITISRNPLEAHEKVRAKRQANPTPGVYCSSNESLCCLHPLEINFTRDLNIHFIARPQSFRANFCNGFCPEVSGTGLMASQRFQILRNLNSSPTRSIKPCCSGIEYEPLQILVQVYNRKLRRYEFSLDLLEQVTVTKCRCG